jgi:glucose/mannose transport system substrate-binding protein
MSRVIFKRAGMEELPAPDSRLASLNDLYQKTSTTLWPFLEALISANNVKYSVPLNLHRTNNLYFNVAKLMKAKGLARLDTISDLGLPTDIDGFLSLVSEVEVARAGPPLAIGIQNLWTLEALVFENLMPSVAMSATDLTFDIDFATPARRRLFYQEFWQGLHPPNQGFSHSVIDGTLRRAQQLWQHVKPMAATKYGCDGLWQCAFDELLRGDSPVTLAVGGDWATGYLESRQAEYLDGFPYVPSSEDESKFSFVPFPGTEQLFIYTTDTLPLTVGAKHPDDTRDFLETALELAVQLEFSEYKGSVPALLLTDSQIDGLSKAYKRETLRLIRDEAIQKSLAISGLMTPDIPSDVLRAPLRDMLLSADATSRETVQHVLENHYWVMALWTKTLELTH